MNNCAPVSLFTADTLRYCPDNYIAIKYVPLHYYYSIYIRMDGFMVSWWCVCVCQRKLEREIKGCQHLILWTDGDREGENIADEIVQVCTGGQLYLCCDGVLHVLACTV